jgi:hypothetical protein
MDEYLVNVSGNTGRGLINTLNRAWKSTLTCPISIAIVAM